MSISSQSISLKTFPHLTLPIMVRNLMPVYVTESHNKNFEVVLNNRNNGVPEQPDKFLTIWEYLLFQK